jgi:hypothetical protein
MTRTAFSNWLHQSWVCSRLARAQVHLEARARLLLLLVNEAKQHLLSKCKRGSAPALLHMDWKMKSQ